MKNNNVVNLRSSLEIKKATKSEHIKGNYDKYQTTRNITNNT